MAVRGRPVSQESRAAAVTGAATVLREVGWQKFSIDEVARRSGVGKATIYRHWPSGFALAVEAWGSVVTDAVPTRSTGDAIADLHDQFVRLAAFYGTAEGAMAVQLLGAAPGRPDGTALVDAVFFRRRRDATRALIEAGVAAGQIRSGLDTDLMIDLLFGPVVFRLFNGRGPLTPDEASAVARATLGGVFARSPAH
ncbi:TetR/AcrR family transcriptional regulator [Curtobacterium sp. SORGH_AS_0776]|uniref:TetR/AcrR family transcriptional regulator n=1 Tax=Curtobacterium sp. SORGH_AS_0776 TaxID=3041798 RepID=UPI00285C16A6|nr:TetR/AcrR family transcriptional regulator [Curtobacterium sp. SORGH_AS_0776]MDR6169103.1 AcrR family transcriptional regulator [Curtobacterium sp. SORGH_AS_0776]